MRNALVLFGAASLSACFLSHGTDGGDDGQPDPGCPPVETRVESAEVPRVIVEGERVDMAVTHVHPEDGDACATMAGADATVAGSRVEIDLSCECDGFTEDDAVAAVPIPDLAPGEYTIDLNGVEYPLTVLPASDCSAVELTGAEVAYPASILEGETVTFSIDISGPRCCDGTASLTQDRSGNDFELTIVERFCESACNDTMRCVDGFHFDHSFAGLPPGEYHVRIGDEVYTFTVIEDPERCELRESTPSSIEIAPEACAWLPVDVVVDHEAEGCGCNVEYGISWSQSSYQLDVISEVQYCPARCYENRTCTDSFRSRGTLLFETPGEYRIRAGSAATTISVLDCSE